MKFINPVKKSYLLFLFALVLTGSNTIGLISNAQTKTALSRDDEQIGRTCLPTGVCLKAAGQSFAVGNMPLSFILSPEGDRFVISLSGWREQGLQIVERDAGKITQKISQPSAFIGLAFSKEGIGAKLLTAALGQWVKEKADSIILLATSESRSLYLRNEFAINQSITARIQNRFRRKLLNERNTTN